MIEDCIHCESPRLIKRGGYGISGQRYKCKTCNKTFVIGGKRIYFTFKEKIYIAKSSLGYGNMVRMCRTFRVSKNTIYKWRAVVAKHEKRIQHRIGYY